jgi:hypothetical protein
MIVNLYSIPPEDMLHAVYARYATILYNTDREGKTHPEQIDRIMPVENKISKALESISNAYWAVQAVEKALDELKLQPSTSQDDRRDVA